MPTRSAKPSGYGLSRRAERAGNISGRGQVAINGVGNVGGSDCAAPRYPCAPREKITRMFFRYFESLRYFSGMMIANIVVPEGRSEAHGAPAAIDELKFEPLGP